MSTFTALNGGSPKSAEQPNGTIEVKTTTTTTPTEQTSKPQPPTAEPPKPAPEASSSNSAQRERDRENWTAPSVDRTYQPASYPDLDASHKRKRSNSPEPRREHSVTQQPSPETATLPRPPILESRESYSTPQRDYRPYGDEARDHGDSWYSRHARDEGNPYDSQQHSASTTHGQTEEQIGEALRRATAGPMDHHSDYPQTSPDGEDRAMSLYSPYSAEQRRDQLGQMDPKKRKRVFSNRTKTGCLTCRKRKKKCDEQKPECE